MLQRHVEKIPAAAGRVEHAHGAQGAVEVLQCLQGAVEVVLAGQGERGGLGVGPVLAQRFDHRGQDEALDVGPRGVVGTERVALVGVERAFQQGAEDGGLDLAPLRAGRVDEQHDLRAGERQHVGLLEQLAVEAQHGHGERHREAAGIHLAPQRGHHAHGGGRVVGVLFQQRAEAVLGQQADVLGEEGEQAAAEERGHGFGGMAGAFERLRHFGQPCGDLARDLGAAPRRVERQRIGPHPGEALADRRVAQGLQRDAVRARVGERHVGRAGARELRVELDHPADVDHHQERRAAFVGRQGAGVGFRLAACAQQGVVEALGGLRALDALALADEGAAAVEVDAARRRAAVAVAEGHPALEDVGVVAVLGAGGLGARQAQQFREFGQEQLVVRQFIAGGLRPAGDEGVGAVGRSVHGGGFRRYRLP